MVIVHWLLDNGVGQNLTAGVIVFLAGVLWSRTKYWPLHALHVKVDALHARHDEHHEHLATVGRSLADLHEKLERLEQTGFQGRANLGQVKGDAGATPKRPRGSRTPQPEQ